MTQDQIRKKLEDKEYAVAWELPCFGIILALDGAGGGSIVSDLHYPTPGIPYEGGVPPEFDSQGEWDNYEAAIDGLESIILAHACAGIEVNEPAYIEGIETAVEAISNNT